MKKCETNTSILKQKIEFQQLEQVGNKAEIKTSSYFSSSLAAKLGTSKFGLSFDGNMYSQRALSPKSNTRPLKCRKSYINLKKNRFTNTDSYFGILSKRLPKKEFSPKL